MTDSTSEPSSDPSERAHQPELARLRAEIRAELLRGQHLPIHGAQIDRAVGAIVGALAGIPPALVAAATISFNTGWYHWFTYVLGALAGFGIVFLASFIGNRLFNRLRSMGPASR